MAALALASAANSAFSAGSDSSFSLTSLMKVLPSFFSSALRILAARL